MVGKGHETLFLTCLYESVQLLEKPVAPRAVQAGPVLPSAVTPKKQMLLGMLGGNFGTQSYGMLRRASRHFFSDGDGLWGEHNPHFGSSKTGDARW